MHTASAPRYLKRCHSPECGSDLQAESAYCKNCGFVIARVGSSEPAVSEACYCRGCGIKLEDARLPLRCQSCDGNAFRWWDSQQGAWLQPDLNPTELAGVKGIWLTGHFTADISGPQTSESSTGTGVTRNYRSPIRGGTLLNPQRVHAPPLRLADGESAPLREAAVSGVQVHFGTDKKSVASVTLHDLRVHDWHTDGTHEFNTSSASLGHRAVAAISGTAFGFLKEKPFKQEQSEPPVPVPLASQPLPPQVATPVEAQGSLPLQSMAGGTGSECWLCRRWVVALLAMGFFLLCGWKEAVFGVMFPALFLCWVPRWLPQTWRSSSDRLGAILVSVGAVAVAWLAFMLAMTGCLAIPWWLPAGLWVALGAAVFFTQCWVRASLLLLWLLVLALHCTGVGSNCRIQTTAQNEVVVPQSPVKSARPDGIGDGGTAQGEQAAKPLAPENLLRKVWVGLQSAVTDVHNWIQAIAFHDPTAEAVGQATGDLRDGRLVTIDQAVAKPQSLSDCKTAIYFPNAAMFEFNSSDLNPEVSRQLAKLEKLREKLPNRELVITGHADKVGAYTDQGIMHNIELSEQRAAAVAEWLATHTGWQLDQMEALGAGNKFPLIDKDGDEPVNRRVEVRLRCTSRSAP